MAPQLATTDNRLMGFYVRKSLKAGPFRVNLSKSGIGVSAGVPGFRVGTGPRGNYVHMGRKGIYYRSSFGTAGRGAASSPVTAPGASAEPEIDPLILDDVTGATTNALAASSSSELLEQIRTAARRHALWPWTAALALVLATATSGLPALAAIVVATGGAAAWWLRLRDQARRTVVVFYDVNDDAAERFQDLVDAFADAATCQRAWQLLAEGAVTSTYQRKINAGATSLVRRELGKLSTAGPPVLITNITVPSLNTKQRAVYFLPDRVLIRSGRSYAEVPWTTVQTACSEQRFIEEGAVPGDSQVIDRTWKFVNKKGGPDRRFKDNRELPVMLYGELEMMGLEGFRSIWQLSRPNAASHLAKAVAAMA